MQYMIKVVITLAIIVTFAHVGRRWPSLGGLLATMPLTSVLVLVWMNAEGTVDPEVLTRYAQGAFWGIIPSLVFFAVAYFGFRRQMAFSLVLSAGFSAWLVGAVVHQWLLKW
jgi:uncharacterized membrane protein (GlpM family)